MKLGAPYTSGRLWQRSIFATYCNYTTLVPCGDSPDGRNIPHFTKSILQLQSFGPEIPVHQTNPPVTPVEWLLYIYPDSQPASHPASHLAIWTNWLSCQLWSQPWLLLYTQHLFTTENHRVSILISRPGPKQNWSEGMRDHRCLAQSLVSHHPAWSFQEQVILQKSRNCGPYLGDAWR